MEKREVLEETKHSRRRTSTARLQVIDGPGNDRIRVCRRNEGADKEYDDRNDGNHDEDGMKMRWVVEGQALREWIWGRWRGKGGMGSSGARTAPTYRLGNYTPVTSRVVIGSWNSRSRIEKI